MHIRHAVVETAIGELTLVASDEALVGIYYPQHWTRPSRDGFGVRVDAAGGAPLAEAAGQLQEYLTGHRTSFDLPTATTGNPFRTRIWELLGEIPFGATTTYGDLAEQVGGRNLARLVGQAVGANPLSIIVPCHRVVGSSGQLTGYAGGLARKQFLLELEGARTEPAGRLF